MNGPEDRLLKPGDFNRCPVSMVWTGEHRFDPTFGDCDWCGIDIETVRSAP